MTARSVTLIDRLIGEIDRAIKVLTVPSSAGRSLPEAPPPESLPDRDRQTSARLMRVNHAGEVAAQALYQGQALAARDPAVEAAMRRSAAEEIDHLAWCQQRLTELQGRPSLLNPLWYAGSFAIGAMAGAFGDRTSLGFVAETEAQVESHLGNHMARLSPLDARSRVILEQMQRDEIEHGATAASLGGTALPRVASVAMRMVSRVMTFGAYWL